MEQIKYRVQNSLENKVYLKEEWINKTIFEIKEKLAQWIEPVIVLVAWWSASWKTSWVARRLNDYFLDNSQILSMDNYYRWPNFHKQHPEINYDQPEALNLELFFKHLEELKKWNSVKIPEFDFKNEPKMDAIEINPSKVIIVEWLFALDENISKLWDVKVFVDIGSHGQILRRIFRDIHRTWQKPHDILSYFLDVVAPMHKKYVLPTRKNAEIIISNEYTPLVESKNSQIQETQLKFPINIEDREHLSDIIYSFWWSEVWEVEHSDYFFNPSDRDFNETDEIVRIRKYGFNKYLFTYKWPKNIQKSYEHRNIISFYITRSTLDAFSELYGRDIKNITKIRRSFFIKWVLVSIDEFENWKKYLEFKFSEENNRMIVLEILEALDIDPNSGIKDSYFNII